MKHYLLSALLALTLGASSHAAEGVAYKPGGPQWAKVWTAFYNGDHEEELMTPLIKAGPKMVPVIVEAISHKDMQLRRYAIGALRQSQRCPRSRGAHKNRRRQERGRILPERCAGVDLQTRPGARHEARQTGRRPGRDVNRHQ